MDLHQRKLIKSEWDSIEIPVLKQEIDILNLIIKGFHDVNIKINKNESIFTFLKIEYSTKMEDYIYNKYLREEVNNVIENNKIYFENINTKLNVNSDIQIKSADKIRLEKNSIENFKSNCVYEYMLLETITKLLHTTKTQDNNQFVLYYYTLYKLLKNNIVKINRHIVTFCEVIIQIFSTTFNILNVIENSVELIEKNTNLLKYNDNILYDHQKKYLLFVKILVQN